MCAPNGAISEATGKQGSFIRQATMHLSNMRTALFHLTLIQVFIVTVGGYNPLPVVLSQPWGQDGPRPDLFFCPTAVFLPPLDSQDNTWLARIEEDEKTNQQRHPSVWNGFKAQSPLRWIESEFQNSETTSVLTDHLQEVASRLLFSSYGLEGLNEAPILLPPCTSLIAPELEEWSTDDAGLVKWLKEPAVLQSDLNCRLILEASNGPLGLASWGTPSTLPAEDLNSPTEIPLHPVSLLPTSDFDFDFDFDFEGKGMYNCEDGDDNGFNSEEWSLTAECTPFLSLPTLFPYHIPSGYSLAGQDHSTSSVSSIVTESEMDLEGFFSVGDLA